MITVYTNPCYHRRRCVEAWHINSVRSTLNRDDGALLPRIQTNGTPLLPKVKELLNYNSSIMSR